jgi:hypothetical protein
VQAATYFLSGMLLARFVEYLKFVFSDNDLKNGLTVEFCPYHRVAKRRKRATAECLK